MIKPQMYDFSCKFSTFADRGNPARLNPVIYTTEDMQRALLLLLLMQPLLLLSCRFERANPPAGESEKPYYISTETHEFLSIEDSLRKALNSTDSLEILFHEHSELCHQAIFAVFDPDSPYYDELQQLFLLQSAQPENRPERLRSGWSTPDSVREALSETMAPLSGLWIRLYPHNDNHYVYLPCGTDTYLHLSDSALYDLSADQPPAILSFEHFTAGPSGELELHILRGKYQSVTIYPYRTTRNNPSAYLFRFSALGSPDRYELMVRLEDAEKFPLIVNSCTFTVEGLSQVLDPDGTLDLSGYEFAYSPPQPETASREGQQPVGWWWITHFIDSIPAHGSIAQSWENRLLESVYLLYVEKGRWTALGRKLLLSEPFGSAKGIPIDGEERELFPLFVEDTLKLVSRALKGKPVTIICRRPFGTETALFEGMAEPFKPGLLETRITDHLSAILLAGSYTNVQPGPDIPSRLIFSRMGEVTGFKPYTRYRIETGFTPSRPHLLSEGKRIPIDLLTLWNGNSSGSAETAELSFWRWQLQSDLLVLHALQPLNQPGGYAESGQILRFRREQ